MCWVVEHRPFLEWEPCPVHLLPLLSQYVFTEYLLKKRNKIKISFFTQETDRIKINSALTYTKYLTFKSIDISDAYLSNTLTKASIIIFLLHLFESKETDTDQRNGLPRLTKSGQGLREAGATV